MTGWGISMRNESIGMQRLLETEGITLALNRGSLQRPATQGIYTRRDPFTSSAALERPVRGRSSDGIV